ncbi:PF06532 family protein [Leptospira fainei serovar Hurstbridge str. BUT 6]|uniref:PF06532 family protein n=1 Tax=Leptospira fainei serovar Hurstbridge str. BUT 6 TaxID=1193011 RepID=S3W4S6_9LEPT|nr:PF06532 family protein [Leptospira fainei serovar Hurstbridge str. BUT 6]
MPSDSDRSEKLILSLGTDLKPTRPLRQGILFLIWTSLLALAIPLGQGTALFLSRNVFPGWWPEPLLFIIWGLVSAYLLSRLAFPEESSAGLIWLPIVGLTLWLGFSSEKFIEEIHTTHSTHIGVCPLLLGVFSLALGGFATFWIRKMIPSNPLLASLAILSFLLAGSNLALKFICPDQSGFHILFSHGIATIFWIAISVLPLRSKLRW